MSPQFTKLCLRLQKFVPIAAIVCAFLETALVSPSHGAVFWLLLFSAAAARGKEERKAAYFRSTSSG